MLNDALFSSVNEDWHTPPHVLELARLVLNGIDLDPASSEAAQKRVHATRYHTSIDDGLGKTWRCRSLWLNPPYGRTIGKWAARFRETALQRYAECGIGLFPARTDTRWFQPFFYHSTYTLCFVRGRLKFSEAQASAPFPSVLIYFGLNDRFFRDTFASIGCSIKIGC